jgi:hypothetical protein
MGVKWSTPCPGRFVIGEKAPVPIALEAGRAPEPIRMTCEVKILNLPGFKTLDSSIIQPIASNHLTKPVIYLFILYVFLFI